MRRIKTVPIEENYFVQRNFSIREKSKSPLSEEEIIVDPEIMTRGFIYERDNMEIINDVKEIRLNVILENTNNKYADYTKIRNDIREKVGSYLYKATQCKPVILTVIQEI